MEICFSDILKQNECEKQQKMLNLKNQFNVEILKY